jgi:hypothetical protein
MTQVLYKVKRAQLVHQSKGTVILVHLGTVNLTQVLLVHLSKQGIVSLPRETGHMSSPS